MIEGEGHVFIMGRVCISVYTGRNIQISVMHLHGSMLCLKQDT